MLVVLDGWGWRTERADNAVLQAKTPHFDALWADGPHSFLHTSGLDVGLPEGQMGNSEVGHLNIGAGRVVMQDLPRISQAISTGALANNPTLQAFIAALRKSGGRCHLMGLVSPGGVHAHQDHAVALATLLSQAKIPTLVHAFTDGRDTPPRSAAEDIKRFRHDLPADVSIATVCGRYYAMDRDQRWERVTQAYHAIVEAQGAHFDDAVDVVTASYGKDVSDEFILPAIIGSYQGMRDGDGILCFNFRADRARELLTALVDPAFTGFARQRHIALAAAAGMTQYSTELDGFLTTLFAPQNLNHVLGQVVAEAGLRQLRMAETEKYPHVTYFLNGGEEAQYQGEDRIMVPSPKVATYDLQPEMSAPELTDKAVEAILSKKYDLIVLNYANPDMVGHTGDLQAAITAVQTVDHGLGRIVAALAQVGGALIATADHGNCEMMRDPQTGGPHTSHTTNLVPVVGFNLSASSMKEGRLADLAPTLLKLMGLKQPAEMTGSPLI
jgi:2,3-bisphosphoglycerate-independent phosphoglycerate mutase